jgi:hypothetical protein
MYPEAITRYKGALEIKPKDSGVITKLKNAEESLAKKNQVALNLSEEQRQENAYQLNISKGDENFKKLQWSNARFFYTEALKIKTEDKYAITQVESCDKMIDGNITAEKLQEYEKLVAKGNEAFKGQNYASAKFYYHNSIELLPWETYPKEKLHEIDRILNENLTLSQRQTIKENLQKADEAFGRKEYSVARFYYNKITEISQDDYCLSKLKEIENIVNGSEGKRVDSEYSGFLKKASEAVQQKNISLARYYYQKAATLKPDETFCKEELKKLNRYN